MARPWPTHSPAKAHPRPSQGPPMAQPRPTHGSSMAQPQPDHGPTTALPEPTLSLLKDNLMMDNAWTNTGHGKQLFILLVDKKWTYFGLDTFWTDHEQNLSSKLAIVNCPYILSIVCPNFILSKVCPLFVHRQSD